MAGTRALIIGSMSGGAKAKSTETLGHLGTPKAATGQGRGAVLKHRSHTPGNCGIMRSGVVCRKVRGQNAEQALGEGGGAEQEQQPHGCLQAVKGGDALQQGGHRLAQAGWPRHATSGYVHGGQRDIAPDMCPAS